MKKKLKKIVYLSCIVTFLFSGVVHANENVIKDKNLKAAINTSLKRDISSDITKEDLEGVKEILAPSNHIRSLEGLQYANNLEVLELAENEIIDASPIKDLKNLKVVGLIHQKAKLKYDKNNLSPVIGTKGQKLPYQTINGEIESITDDVPATYSWRLDGFSGTIEIINKEVPKQEDFKGVTIVDRDDKPIEKAIEEDKARLDGKLEVKSDGKTAIKGNSILSYIFMVLVIAVLFAGAYIIYYYKARQYKVKK